MLKKLLSGAVVLVLAILAFGIFINAADNSPDNHSNGNGDEIAVAAMPDDFYIVYEIGWRDNLLHDDLVALLDTKNNIVGLVTNMGIAFCDNDVSGPWIEATKMEYILLDYCIPLKTLQEIYGLIIQYDIKSYSSPSLLTREDIRSDVESYVKITFCINGEIFNIFYDDSYIGEEKLCIFVHALKIDYYLNFDVVKAFFDTW